MRQVIFEGELSVRQWETYAHEVPIAYARHGDLVRRFGSTVETNVTRGSADEELDAEIEETKRRRDALDRLVRRRRPGSNAPGGLLVEALLAAPSDIMLAIYGGLALSCWNEARRLSGESELQAINFRHRGRPFASLAEALAFLRDGVPPNDDDPTWAPLGAGPLNLVVAEDRTEDLRARARMVREGRVVRKPDGSRHPGFLPQEFIPARQTHSGGARARSQALVELELEITIAAQRAGLISPDGVWSEALRALCALHVGRWTAVPRKQRIGAETRHGRGRGTWARGAQQHRLEPISIGDLAVELESDVVTLKQSLARARKALVAKLRARHLIPEEPKARAARRREPAPFAAPLVAKW